MTAFAPRRRNLTLEERYLEPARYRKLRWDPPAETSLDPAPPTLRAKRTLTTRHQ
ncbi:MAG TPA: hypothetical protein VG432_12215 [Gemmatimonadaceae bacterium]|nr:hypothetical protein [Gemmatimonadaceae bacterium]